MIITAILFVLVGLIHIIMLPIDAIINAAIPDLSAMTTAIVSLFAIVTNTVAWAVSATGLSSVALGMVVAYYAFVLTVPAFAWLIKLMLKWWHAVHG